MYIQKDNVLEAPNLSSGANYGLDPISREALGRHARQVEMLRFLPQAIKAVFNWLVRWNERIVLDRELRAMPDYLLKDIGIERDQISAVASYKLRREDLTLSPTGSQVVAGGFKPVAAANEDKETNKPLAA